ncbi:MAG: DNA cytosine methyltransferase [Lachnospiraceae bacterium]|nr:DNA cytosine methyltransferase [Lachnospiraceae bacterium]
MPYAIDLFCGAGGCSEGLIQAGFHILFSSDISEMVEVTYKNRHAQLGLIQGQNTWFERADIKNLHGNFINQKISELGIFHEQEVPEIDLMIGGPSCQGFSRAGRRDKEDPRNLLFGEYVRVINEVMPKYIVLENVEGFMDMQFLGYKGLDLYDENGNLVEGGPVYPDGSVTPAILKSELNRIGYDTLEPRILNAADYGVPQRRNRVIFIGYRRELPAPSYPEPTVTPEKQLKLKDAISDLVNDKKLKNKISKNLSDFQKESRAGRTPSLSTGKPIPCDRGHLKNLELPKATDIVLERFDLFNEGESSSMLRKRIKEYGIDISGKNSLIQLCCDSLGMQSNDVIELFKRTNASDDAIDVLLTKKNIRKRLNSIEPSPTVVTLPDDYINPWEARTISVREMARCQSFDDSFEFLGKRTTGGLKRRTEVPQCTQVGNAVPPLLAKAVALEIIKVL